MKNSWRNQVKQLLTKNKVKVPLGESTFKLNISEYSLDNYKTFNPEGYTMMCHIVEASNGFSYFHKTSKLVLDTRQQSILINNFNQLVPNVAEDFGITQQAAFEKFVDFFFEYTRYCSTNGNRRKILQNNAVCTKFCAYGLH